MATFIPEIEKIKKEYIYDEKMKRILNWLYKRFKDNNDIEIHVHTMLFNTAINIAILTKNGTFIITENELGEEKKKMIHNFLNSFHEAASQKLKIEFLEFSSLEKDKDEVIREIEIFSNKNIVIKEDELQLLEKSFHEMKGLLFMRISSGKDKKYLKLSAKQAELVLKRENFKVKGGAGSGKSTVIIEKVAYDFKEHNRSSLIVLFNITGRNYIRQRLCREHSDLDFSKIKVVHYDGLDAEINGVEENEKFDNIFIDEAQDFKKPWYEKIECGYLKENGNIYIFGDEKQNIYERELESKNIYTPLSGAWNILKSSYRMESKARELSLKFQKTFYENKYDIDEISIPKEITKKKMNNILFGSDITEASGEVVYKYFEDRKSFLDSTVFDYINHIIEENKFPLNTVAILTSEIEVIHPVMDGFSDEISLLTISVETSEEREKIKECFRIEKIRRNRKLNFQSDGDSVVFSTIHSFKGLERDNIILLLSDKSPENKRDELIYTGITRASKNLYIINIGLEKYNNFFFENSKMEGLEI